jgi:AcrR family transcriptional regulator
MQTSELGLRERKRVETRDRLESAAVTLVLRDGLERATIDAICETADVSSRTFFNYFDSKEDAILGLQYSAITDDAVSEIIASHRGADPVELIVRLMFGVLDPTINSTTLFTSRVAIMKKHPQLLGRVANQIQRMNEQLMNAIRPILRDVPGFADEDPASAEFSVDVVLSLCSEAKRPSRR